MEKPHEEEEIGGDCGAWGTWEELLLACAVNRHGTNSWDFVAMEVQTRTSSSLLLDARNCRRKYHDLQHRFVAVDSESNGRDDASDERTFLCVEELRKLRVAELRRQVQRSDLSIVSLQQKVKKLKEDRDRGLKEKENDDEISDLNKEVRGGESEKSSPVDDVGEQTSGEESGRQDRSFSESNSTDPKGKSAEIGAEAEREPDVAAAGGADPVPGKSVGGDGSYDGSSDTTARAAGGEAAPVPVRESVAEWKGSGGEEEAAAAKESSDVQSSASLSRKRRRREEIPGRCSGDEADVDVVSPAGKRPSVKSQRSDRLAGFLEVIRSHKHGAVFNSRLQSQESVDYNNVIRQHVDLEMVNAKLEEGLYSNSSSSRLQFFRDLLLLFNNSIVFFPKNSMEYLAAIELRELVSKEMKTMTQPRSKPISNQLKQNPPPKKPASPVHPLLLKSDPNPSRPIAAFRKRSSISLKPPLRLPVVEAKRKGSGADAVKLGSDRNEPDEVDDLSKQRPRERPPLIRTRGAAALMSKSRRSSNVTPPKRVSNSDSVTKAAGSLREEIKEVVKTEEEEIENAIAKKKNGVVNLLNRMKRGASGPASPVKDKLKEAVNGRGRGRGRGEKKIRGGKGGRDVRRDQPVRHGSGRKEVQEQRNSGRSVGRPAKRAAPPQQQMAPPSSRKAREKVDVEKKPHRKRARR